MRKILVSIIVPIYNVEKYMNKCIDSIINQSYKNLEIILIDDGSTDASSRICDNYEKTDKRVRVVHRKNGGISDARNSGIKISTGEYLSFIDGDDYIHGDFIETLLSNSIENNADISVCGYVKVYVGHEKVINKNIESKVFTRFEALKDIFSYPTICEVVIWNKLYKKSLFQDNHIQFPKDKIHEDNFMTYKLFSVANKVIFVNKALYFYVQRQGSIMHSAFSIRSFDLIEAAYETVRWVDTNEPELREIVRAYQLRLQITLLNKMSDTKKTKSELLEYHRRNILQGKLGIQRNQYITKKQKISLLFLKFGQKPYAFYRKIYLSLKGME